MIHPVTTTREWFYTYLPVACCLETVVFEREQACATVCEERVKACGLFWAGGWGQRGMCLRESDNLDPVREKKKKTPKSLSAVTAGTFPN